MKFTRSTKYKLLILLILLNVILRYPVTSHMFGTDSFFIHTLATSISEYGCAKWFIHPLSLIGVYPLSYGSMYPFLLSGTSVSSNLSIERVVLLMGYVLSIFGLLSIYLVAKEMKDDDLFSFLVAFVFSTSPVFFFYTNWTAGTRGVFISFIPIFIYLLIKIRRKYKYLILAFVFLLLFTTVHRLFFLLPLIFIAYLGTLFLTRYINKISLNVKHPNLYRLVFVVIIISSLVYVQSNKLSENYSSGVFIEEADELNVTQKIGFLFSLFNLLVNFTGKIGFNLLFGFTGFVYLLSSKHLTFNKTFFISCGIFLVLTLPYRYYTSLFYLPFISVFMGYGIALSFSATRQINKKISYIFIISIIVSTILFSGYMDGHWKKIPTNGPMKDETYHTALFVREKINGTTISNGGGLAQQINAISKKPVLPFGIQHWFTPAQFIYEFEDKNNLHAEFLPIKDLFPPPDIWYSFSGVSNIKEDYQIIMYNDINMDSVNKMLSKYDIKHVHLYKPLGNIFISYGQRNSNFIPSMVKGSGQIYESNTESIWYI